MSAGDLANFISCSIGPASFTLETYSLKTTAIVEDDRGRTGTKFSVSGKGYVSGADQASVQEAIDAFLTASNASGVDLVMRGLGGGVEWVIPAAKCLNGAPHLSGSVEPGDANQRVVTFSAEGEMIGAPGGDGDEPTESQDVDDTHKVEASYRPGQLRTVTRSGELTGPDAQGYFNDKLVAQVREQYPLPKFVVTYKVDWSNKGGGLKANYTFTINENANPLPAGAGEAIVVDGEVSHRVERDEQLRKVTTYAFDLVVKGGDPWQVANELRNRVFPPTDTDYAQPGGPRVMPLRESIEITSVRDVKVRASFTRLEGGDGNRLIGWQQTLRLAGADPTYEERTFPGAAPIYIRRPEVRRRYVQSGTATAVGAYPKPPEPFMPVLLERPDVTFSQGNAFERTTAWSYTGFFDSAEGGPPVEGVRPWEMDRPKQPEFYSP